MKIVHPFDQSIHHFGGVKPTEVNRVKTTSKTYSIERGEQVSGNPLLPAASIVSGGVDPQNIPQAFPLSRRDEYLETFQHSPVIRSRTVSDNAFCIPIILMGCLTSAVKIVLGGGGGGKRLSDSQIAKETGEHPTTTPNPRLPLRY